MKENKVFQKFKALVSLFLPYCNLKDYIKTTGRNLSLPIIDFVTLGLFKHFQGILTKQSVYDTLSIGDYCSYKTLCVNTNFAAARSPWKLAISGRRPSAIPPLWRDVRGSISYHRPESACRARSIRRRI